MRSMVVGAHRSRGDCVGSANRIRQHALRRDPQNPVPVFIQKAGAFNIAPWLVTHVVGNAVNLDRQASRGTEKIHNIRPDWMLAAELQTMRAQAQSLPQHPLGQRHFLA